MYSRNRYVAFLVTLLIFFTSITSLSAQEDEEWYLNKTITKITFSDLQRVKQSELNGIVSAYIGKTVDECISDMIDRLYALDLFDDISPSALHDSKDGVIIDFKVKEKPQIMSINFRGNKMLRNGTLRDAISIKRNDIFVERKVLVDERAIREAYLDKGYTNIRVSYEKKDTPEGVDITFVIKEGRSTVVSAIVFEGNTIFSSRTLKGKLKTKEVGIINSGSFQEAVLENDKQAILTYYHDRGYIDASIIDVGRDFTINEEKNRDELVITFYIQEGIQYTYDSISFVGNKVFTTEVLQNRFTMKKGEIFNQTKFQQGIMNIADLYYENGYTSNGFAPVANKDSTTRTVSYVINITERDRSHIEHVIVKGNTKTKEEVITRELPLESGDVFSKANITSGLRNLYNLQYFSAVVPEIVPGSEENLVDVVISVEEQMTNSIEFGLTFSGVTDPSELPFALFAKWSNSNVAGTGRSLSASTTLSSTEQSVSLGYGQNWLFGLPIQLSESLSITHAKSTALRLKWLQNGTTNSEDYYMQYETVAFNLDSSVGHRWTPNFAIITASGGITNSLTDYIYDEGLVVPIDTTISDYANKWGLSNSIWARISLDGRDVNYDPSIGWFFSQQASWYGLTPWETDFYFKTDTKLEGYFPIVNIPVSDKWSFKLIFAAYTGITFQFPAEGSGVSDNNKLYLDGMFDARGWTEIYRSVRGRAKWSNRFELRFPVVPGIIALDGFFDVAAIKKSPQEMFSALKPSDWYFSVGPDIRFLLPQFPMRLMLASTFKIEEDKVKWDKTWQFVLSFNVVNK